MQYIYTMKGLGKVHPPDAVVLKDIWLSFLPGAKIGVLGLNGSGKSSLLKVMAGEDHEFTGEAYPADGITVGFLQQEPRLNPDKTVKGNVEEGVAEVTALLDRYDALNMKLGEDLSPEAMDKVLEEQGKLQDRIDTVNAWDIDSQLELAMDALRCPAPDADVSTLSGGERRRVALCRLLLKSPDLLLLDEPTNHLDAESVAWLERFLADYKGTIVAVTHDRYFLDNVAGWILELDRGAGIPWEGNYSSWLDQKRKRLESEEKSESARQRTLARELEWVKASPRARQAKSKARLAAYDQMLADEQQKRDDTIEIAIPPGPRLGQVVVEAEKLRKGYGENLLIDDLSFKLPPGGIVGIIGPNGAGKTTLFRMITGMEKPDAGTLRIGETVQIGYVDQSREALSPDKTVWQEISDGLDEIELGKKKVASRAYVSWFNFKGAGQQQQFYFITHESILGALHNFGSKFEDSALRVDDALVRVPNVYRASDDLFELLVGMRDRNAALIVDEDQCLRHVVTSYDTSQYFRQWAEDIMQVRDVEHSLRRIINSAFKKSDGEIDEERRKIENDLIFTGDVTAAGLMALDKFEVREGDR